MPNRFCEHCGQHTEHSERLKQKPSKYGKSRKEQFKAFLSGFFSGGGAFPGATTLELTDRYVCCTKCGKETRENCGEEFE